MHVGSYRYSGTDGRLYTFIYMYMHIRCIRMYDTSWFVLQRTLCHCRPGSVEGRGGGC